MEVLAPLQERISLPCTVLAVDKYREDADLFIVSAIEGPPIPTVEVAMPYRAAAPPPPNTPRKKKKKASSSSSSLFSLKCSCSKGKSVSVSISTSHSAGSQYKTADNPSAASLSASHHRHALSARFEYSSADTTLTMATTSYDDEEEARSPCFSELLRQLREMERSVLAWDHRRPATPDRTIEADELLVEEEEHGQQRRRQRHHHRRSHSEGGIGWNVELGEMGGSLVVVTETQDPLGEFRRSMLEMIVEEDMVRPEELRELLRRFLALNSPSNHDIIVRAFADVWRDVFSGYHDQGIHLVTAVRSSQRLRRQHSYHDHHFY